MRQRQADTERAEDDKNNRSALRYPYPGNEANLNEDQLHAEQHDGKVTCRSYYKLQSDSPNVPCTAWPCLLEVQNRANGI